MINRRRGLIASGGRGNCQIGFCRQVTSIAGSVAEDTLPGIVVGASIKVLGNPQRDNGAVR